MHQHQLFIIYSPFIYHSFVIHLLFIRPLLPIICHSFVIQNPFMPLISQNNFDLPPLSTARHAAYPPWAWTRYGPALRLRRCHLRCCWSGHICTWRARGSAWPGTHGDAPTTAARHAPAWRFCPHHGPCIEWGDRLLLRRVKQKTESGRIRQTESHIWKWWKNIY